MFSAWGPGRVMLCNLSCGCKFFLWPDFCKGLGEWTGGRESGGGRAPGSPFPISLGVVHLQPGSESYLEDTPGNQLQLRWSLYLACRQINLFPSLECARGRPSPIPSIPLSVCLWRYVVP